MADVEFKFHGRKLGLTPESSAEETRAAILHAISNYGAVVAERDEYRRQVVELSGGRGAPIEGVPGLRGGFEPVTASRSTRGSVRTPEMVEFDARRAAMRAEDAARRVEASRPATGAVQEALDRAQATGGDPKAVVATDPELRSRCARDPLPGPFPTAQSEVDARYLRAFAADPAIKSGEFLKTLYAADPSLRARATRERSVAGRKALDFRSAPKPKGDGMGGKGIEARMELDRAAAAIVADDPSLTNAEAVREAYRRDPGLFERISAARQAKRDGGGDQ